MYVVRRALVNQWKISTGMVRWSLTLSDRVTSSLSVGREREEVGPGRNAIHQDPDFRAIGRARSKFSCQGFWCFLLFLFFFFISSSSSSVFFLYRLSLIHRFIGKLPFLLSATFFCLSFNFPIFSAKQAPGEIDVIPSILCLIGFPSFRGNFAVFLFFLDFFLLVRRIFRVSRKYLFGIYFPI